MVRNPATGRLDFDFDETGNPAFSDTNTHRVLSLVIEHRPSPSSPSQAASPGWWADETGERGSLLYTLKNLRRRTPSEAESMVRSALQKAVDEGKISDVDARSFLSPATRARIEISWRNPGSVPGSAVVALTS